MLKVLHGIIDTHLLKMCNIGALVSVWKAFTGDLRESRDLFKMQATSNASNETPRFVEVNFLEAVLVGFNY